MRWLVIPCCAMVAALAFAGWAALTHPGADPYDGPFEVVAQTSATGTVITAQGGRVPHGGQVVIGAAGSGFWDSDSCDALPCVIRVGSGGLTDVQAQMENAAGQVVATATTGS